ncbi:hypothetical protein AAVH_24586 [Aphelenchoides avenae]|nr:hypothetical protein AAVH_24586 [Aphelenchus avenae]
MSSIPSEVLQDVLQPLDRWTLDGVQFTNRRFLQLIMERMTDVCLRQINLAAFQMPEIPDTGESWYWIRIDVAASREIKKKHEDTVHVFSEFVQALRSSCVAHLTLNDFAFTTAFAKLFLETPVVVQQLRFNAGSFAELTHALFHEVVLYLSPTSLFIYHCHLYAGQITDEFFRALCKNGLLCAFFDSVVPLDGGKFAVTDDAVIDFCMQSDVHVGQEEDEPLGELVLDKGNFTKDLFKRLVEVST